MVYQTKFRKNTVGGRGGTVERDDGWNEADGAGLGGVPIEEVGNGYRRVLDRGEGVFAKVR